MTATTSARNYTLFCFPPAKTVTKKTMKPQRITKGQPVPHNQSLMPILAYWFNNANLSSSEGPLQLAIVKPEGLATRSAYWVKFVVKMEILSAPAEFPWWLLTTPVFIFAVIMAAAVYRKRSRTVSRPSDTNQRRASVHI